MTKTTTLKQIYKHPRNFAFKKIVHNNGLFSHGVYLAEKWKMGKEKSQWYAKYLGERRDETLAEILTQELMRLILPEQPKTRRIIDVANRKIEYYVLSKEIPEFDDTFFLKEENNKFILNNNIIGLAATQVIALWLNEVDFKPGNVGIDPHKKTVVKIDGGMSLVTLNNGYNRLHNRNFNITSVDLEALPNLVHYQACNWLHHIRWHKKDEKEYAVIKEPTELDKRINQNPFFKKELYRTILQIISLPDQLIQFFTQCYIANLNDVVRFSNFIIERKKQLELAAEQMFEFKKYRESKQSQQEISDFSKRVATFRPQEKLNLCSAFKKKHHIDIETTIIEYLPIKKFITELDNYLTKLNSIDSNRLSIDYKNTNENIDSLKENAKIFLNSPTIIQKKELINSLMAFINFNKNKVIVPNSITSSLTESIYNLLSIIDNMGKSDALTPSPQPNFTPLPSIGFFKAVYPNLSKMHQQCDLSCSY